MVPRMRARRFIALTTARLFKPYFLPEHLAEVDAHGSFYDARELDDVAELLGYRPSSLADGRARVAREIRSHRTTCSR